jgi:hypothetical protein
MNKFLIFALFVVICYNISIYAAFSEEPIGHTCRLPIAEKR